MFYRTPPRPPPQEFSPAYTRGMPSLLERLSADLKDAMRAGDAMRRDEIRSLIAMFRAAQQTKLTQSLEQHGLIIEEGPDAVLSPAQLAEIERLRAASSLNEDEEQAVLVRSVVQHRQSI